MVNTEGDDGGTGRKGGRKCGVELDGKHGSLGCFVIGEGAGSVAQATSCNSSREGEGLEREGAWV